MSKLRITKTETFSRNLKELKTNDKLQAMTKEQLIAEIKTNNATIGRLRVTSSNRLGQIRSMRVHLKGIHDRVERILKTPFTMSK